MAEDEDFGYDFSADDEEALFQLASSMTTASVHAQQESHHHHHHHHHHVLVPTASAPPPPAGMLMPGAFPLPIPPDGRAEQAAAGPGISYPNLSAALRSLEHERSRSASKEPMTIGDALAPPRRRYKEKQKQKQNPPREQSPVLVADSDADAKADADAAMEDPRSPLERFRRFPQKVLTVSDLTAGAWCELKYWYTLTKLPGGRAIRTPAMKQGSKVHQKLEQEVHTSVRIEITTKEDGFGLRLWNLIQGLRTLRDTGLTRELEVWGVVDGELVNGVVDSVSSAHPNPEFEEQLLNEGSFLESETADSRDYFPTDPTDLDQMNHTSSESSADRRASSVKYYLGDVKTRGSYGPVSNATFRPAKIQLLLYHRLLSDMAAGKLDYFKVLQRYGLDPDARFSDYFLSQVGDLHDEIFFDSSSISLGQSTDRSCSALLQTASSTGSSPNGSASASAPDLLRYGTLGDLVALVEEEVRLTFPRGASSLGHILSVQYVHRSDGREISTHDFPVSAQSLTAYLESYMGWWRGERRAAGVDIEEAFKCGSCDFAGECSWRREMDEARVAKARRKMAGGA